MKALISLTFLGQTVLGFNQIDQVTKTKTNAVTFPNTHECVM